MADQLDEMTCQLESRQALDFSQPKSATSACAADEGGSTFKALFCSLSLDAHAYQSLYRIRSLTRATVQVHVRHQRLHLCPRGGANIPLPSLDDLVALVALVAHTITPCHTETTPDPVSLQILKAPLPLVLSPTILVTILPC